MLTLHLLFVALRLLTSFKGRCQALANETVYDSKGRETVKERNSLTYDAKWFGEHTLTVFTITHGKVGRYTTLRYLNFINSVSKLLTNG